jgi:hypothetical protein
MSEDSQDINIDRGKFKEAMEERESWKDTVEKDFIPNFFPTFRIKSNLYPLPIIITVICAGFLAYITYVIAEVNYLEGGYVSEQEYGAAAGLINGLIFTLMAVISAFIMIYFVKRKGIEVLKYIFGFSFGFLGFFLTTFFGEIIIYVIFSSIPLTQFLFDLYNVLIYVILPIATGIFVVILIYKYFTSESFHTKNFIVIYIGLLIGAIMGVIMPIWTTLAILIGISLWDIFAVKSKRGPIKEMIDIASKRNEDDGISDDDIEEKIESGEMEYDTSKLEIGIGDLAFYSMLTSSALIQTGNVIVMILTSIAIIIGTGITISGLKRNKILPGLPISIFLGLGTMFISGIIVIVFL